MVSESRGQCLVRPSFLPSYFPSSSSLHPSHILPLSFLLFPEPFNGRGGGCVGSGIPVLHLTSHILSLHSSFRETCCDLVTRQDFPAAALLSLGTGYFSVVDCPVRCRVFSSISGLYSLLARSTPSCDNQKYLRTWPALPRDVRSLFVENHGSKGWWDSNLIFPQDPLSSIHVPLHCVDFCPHWGSRVSELIPAPNQELIQGCMNLFIRQ